MTFDRIDGIGRVTIRRPQARNALSWDAMAAFGSCVEQAHHAEDLRALIVAGEGEAFCAGGDLVELHNFPSFSDGIRLADGMSAALDRLAGLPVPTIAAIEGPALGGGAEIALACDLRVMGDGATLGMMHIRLAITPAWGGGQRLVELVGRSRALEWLAEGRVFTAEEALAVGLANRRAPRGGALEAAVAMAGPIAANDPSAVRAVKRITRAGITRSFEAALAFERSEFPPLWAAPAHLQASDAFLSRKRRRPSGPPR